jgi:hypothetical protein
MSYDEWKTTAPDLDDEQSAREGPEAAHYAPEAELERTYRALPVDDADVLPF